MSKPIVKEILSWVITIVVAVVLALLIKRYVFCIANVPTGSMIPAIQINDKIVISTVSLYFQDIEVDDLVVFKPTEYIKNNRSEKERNAPLVKRVIAKGGDTVEVKKGDVYVNGVLKNEPYVYAKSNDDFGPVTIPEDSYFVMGDNRTKSWDARYWPEPYISRDLIIGKAVYKFGGLH